MKIRMTAAAGALLLLCGAGQAAARGAHQSFAGHWTFLTQVYDGKVLAGTVLATETVDDVYAVRIVTIWRGNRGQTQVAHQQCVGIWDRGALEVSCDVKQADGNYAPDNFRLQPTGGGAWSGELISTSRANVLFVPI